MDIQGHHLSRRRHRVETTEERAHLVGCVERYFRSGPLVLEVGTLSYPLSVRPNPTVPSVRGHRTVGSPSLPSVLEVGSERQLEPTNDSKRFGVKGVNVLSVFL